jgi:hypothetical protein
VNNILKHYLVPVTFVIAIGVIVLGTMSVSSYYLNQKYASAHSGCSAGRPNHTVTITSGVVSPKNTFASQCDSLTITNLDDTSYMIAFGLHEDHVPYDGISEQMLSKGQSVTLTLKEVGHFRFHDHIRDEVHGTFTVQASK